MTTTHARVLILTSDGISSLSGTGVTLRNLFAEWPVENIAQLHLDDSPTGSDMRQFRLPRRSVPIDHAARRFLGRMRPAFADGAPAIAAVPLQEGALQAARMHAHVRAALDLSPVLRSPAVNEFVRAFEPDVIYSLLGSARVMRLAQRISGLFDVPIVPHFMDDWPSTLYSSGELFGLARRNRDRSLRKILEQAPFALCISEAMCEDYESRFGITCYPFANPVPDPEDMVSLKAGRPTDFVYTGGLHLGRWEVLQTVARAIQQLFEGATLMIHAPEADLAGVHVPQELAPALLLGRSLAPEQVAPRLRRADVLVHVESLEPATARYTRLSLSTKVPQYLSAGRPLLAVGPEGQASIRVVRESGGGVVFTGSRGLLEKDQLCRLLDVEERQRMARSGRQYAADHFGQTAVRSSLRKLLASASRL